MRNPTQWWRARRKVRLARHEALIAGVLLYTPDLSGWPLMQRTGLNAAQLYTALQRMELDGRVESRWADGPFPRRRLYRLAAEVGGRRG
jgi:hypothetical protein